MTPIDVVAFTDNLGLDQWQEREREADIQIESGHVEYFADEESLDSALESHGKAN
ncbi:MAG: hypothetical protein NVSMB52_21100 [Chloroflexota bacterium]